MQITHRDRWEYAKRSSRALEGWKLRALEALVLGVVIYYALPDAMSELASFGIATAVGLGAFPVLEMMGNYFDSRGIELEMLRAEVGRLRATAPGSLVVPDTPGRIYLQEKDSAVILRRLQKLKWQERDVIAKTSYIGRWVRWEGRVARVVRHLGDNLAILVKGQDFYSNTYLNFSKAEQHIAESLDEGLVVVYEGQIGSVDEGYVSLDNVTILQRGT